MQWDGLRQCCHGAPYYLKHPLLRGMQRFPLGRVHELVRKDVVQKLPVLAHTDPGKGREETVWEKRSGYPELLQSLNYMLKEWKMTRIQNGLFPLLPRKPRVSVSTSLLKSVVLGKTVFIEQRGQIHKLSKVHPVQLEGAIVPLFLELNCLKKYVWRTFCVPGSLEPGDDLVLFFSFLLFSCTAWQLLDHQGRPNNLILTFQDFTIQWKLQAHK